MSINFPKINFDISKINTPIILMGALVIFISLTEYYLLQLMVNTNELLNKIILIIISFILILFTLPLCLYLIIKYRSKFMSDKELNNYIKNKSEVQKIKIEKNIKENNNEKEKRIILELLANRTANETNTIKLFIQLARGRLQDTTIAKFEKYLEDTQATFHVAITLLSKMTNKSSQYDKLKGLTGIIDKTASYGQLISLFE